jgi:hypothetical protein
MEHGTADEPEVVSQVLVTVEGCDNGDVQMRLELDDTPGYSLCVLHAVPWGVQPDDEYGIPAATAWVGNGDDYAVLDLDGMRALRAGLDEMIARVEAHDAASSTTADADPAEIHSGRADADDDTDGMA